MFVKRTLLHLSALLAVLFVALAANETSAHGRDQSYVYFQVSDNELTGRIEATVADLAKVLPLDNDGDGLVSQDEILSNKAKVFDYLLSRFSLEIEGRTLEIEPAEIEFLDVNWGVFVLANFSVPQLTDVPDEIDVTFRVFYEDLDGSHIGYALIEKNTRTGLEYNESQISLEFGEGSERQRLSLVSKPWYELLWIFVEHGAWHIWLGLDHALFLIALLIPSVMTLRDDRWVPAKSLRQPLWDLIKLVTVFTLANSITLSLAALKLVSLPSRIIDASMALSIAIVALTTLIPRLHKHILVVVALFGLIHGFGFASVLQPLDIEPNRKFLTLAGFNLGIEFGQIVIVLVLLPFLFVGRATWAYSFLVLKLGSIVLVALGLFWFEERLFDLMGPVGPTVRGWFGF